MFPAWVKVTYEDVGKGAFVVPTHNEHFFISAIRSLYVKGDTDEFLFVGEPYYAGVLDDLMKKSGQSFKRAERVNNIFGEDIGGFCYDISPYAHGFDGLVLKCVKDSSKLKKIELVGKLMDKYSNFIVGRDSKHDFIKYAIVFDVATPVDYPDNLFPKKLV